MTKKDYRGLILETRFKFLRGEITLDEAKNFINPLLIEMNDKGKKIAKKYGKNYKPLTFGYVFR